MMPINRLRTAAELQGTQVEQYEKLMLLPKKELDAQRAKIVEAGGNKVRSPEKQQVVHSDKKGTFGREDTGRLPVLGTFNTAQDVEFRERIQKQKELEDKEKRKDAEATWKAWRQEKDEMLKELAMEKRKEKAVEDKKSEKPSDPAAFIAWKRQKDDLIRQKRQEQKEILLQWERDQEELRRISYEKIKKLQDNVKARKPHDDSSVTKKKTKKCQAEIEEFVKEIAAPYTVKLTKARKSPTHSSNGATQSRYVQSIKSLASKERQHPEAFPSAAALPEQTAAQHSGDGVNRSAGKAEREPEHQPERTDEGAGGVSPPPSAVKEIAASLDAKEKSSQGSGSSSGSRRHLKHNVEHREASVPETTAEAANDRLTESSSRRRKSSGVKSIGNQAALAAEDAQSQSSHHHHQQQPQQQPQQQLSARSRGSQKSRSKDPSARRGSRVRLQVDIGAGLSLSLEDLDQLRQVSNPSKSTSLVLGAVCAILEESPYTWSTACKVLADNGVLERLKAQDQTRPRPSWEIAKRFTGTEGFHPEAADNAEEPKAVACLRVWTLHLMEGLNNQHTEEQEQQQLMPKPTDEGGAALTLDSTSEAGVRRTETRDTQEPASSKSENTSKPAAVEGSASSEPSELQEHLIPRDVAEAVGTPPMSSPGYEADFSESFSDVPPASLSPTLNSTQQGAVAEGGGGEAGDAVNTSEPPPLEPPPLLPAPATSSQASPVDGDDLGTEAYAAVAASSPPSDESPPPIEHPENSSPVVNSDEVQQPPPAEEEEEEEEEEKEGEEVSAGATPTHNAPAEVRSSEPSSGSDSPNGYDDDFGEPEATEVPSTPSPPSPPPEPSAPSSDVDDHSTPATAAAAPEAQLKEVQPPPQAPTSATGDGDDAEEEFEADAAVEPEPSRPPIQIEPPPAVHSPPSAQVESTAPSAAGSGDVEQKDEAEDEEFNDYSYDDDFDADG